MPFEIAVLLVFLKFLEKNISRQFPVLMAVLPMPINQKGRISTAHYIRSMIRTSDVWV